MRVIISAGGTGGHLYPALALAAALASRDRRSDILFVTGTGVLEKELVEQAGFDVISLDAPGIRRKLSPELAKTAYKLSRATGRATKIVKEFEPDVVIGFGGAVTFPVIRAARALKIPTAIHEQNVVPGLANRYLGGGVDVIAVSSDEAKAAWPDGKRIVVTGNPVRTAQVSVTAGEARDALGLAKNAAVVTVFGGSQGAQHINQTVIKAYNALAAKAEIMILHLTGSRDFEETVKAWSESGAGGHVKLLPYLDEMGLAYRASDLMVCRAGASTLAELGVYGTPAILIPYPYAANDHQSKNAAEVERAGGAVVIADKDLFPERLSQQILELMEDADRREVMAAAMLSQGRPNAAESLADLVTEIAKGTGNKVE